MIRGFVLIVVVLIIISILVEYQILNVDDLKSTFNSIKTYIKEIL